MADISKITLPSGSVYNLKDAQARSDIADIQAAISGGLTFLGETTTPLADQATTNPVVINGESVTASAGAIVVYGQKEFLFNGTKWLEMGDLSLLGALAYKSTASGSFTPAGTVSQPTFSGESMTSSGTFTPSGSVSAPEISVDTAGATTNVNSITSVGSLPSFSCAVANENLTMSWDAGALPTKGANTTVKTGDATYSASAPTFTGTQGNVSVSGTPAGSVSQPTFNGTQDTVTVS